MARFKYAGDDAAAGNHAPLSADVLVVGGGPAGTWAAIKAAQAGADVVLVDKGRCGSSGATASVGTGIWYVEDEPELREAPRPAQYPDGAGLAGGGSVVVSTMGIAVKAGPRRRLYRTASASRPIWSGEAVVGTNMSSSQPTEANASA